jgi:hypothetical protein
MHLAWNTKPGIQTYSAAIGQYELLVTKHHPLRPGTWVAVFNPFTATYFPLNADSEVSAKKQAVDMATFYLKKAVDSFSQLQYLATA